MTGRRLYELVTDAIGSETSEYGRDRGWQGQLPANPRAWGILRREERRIWTVAAGRITPAKAKR